MIGAKVGPIGWVVLWFVSTTSYPNLGYGGVCFGGYERMGQFCYGICPAAAVKCACTILFYINNTVGIGYGGWVWVYIYCNIISSCTTISIGSCNGISTRCSRRYTCCIGSSCYSTTIGSCPRITNI